MKRLITTTAGGVLLLAAGFAHAAHPGFVDLKSLDARAGASPTVAVSVNDWLLKLGQDALKDDPELAALAGLESVSVRIYKDAALELGQAAADMAAELRRAGWMPVAQVNDGDDRVSVLMMPGTDHIAGVTVLVHDSSGEAVFVNAYGSIRPDDLGRLLSGVGDLGGLDLAGAAR